MNDIATINALEGLKNKASCRKERMALDQAIKAIKKLSPEFKAASIEKSDCLKSDNPYQE